MVHIVQVGLNESYLRTGSILAHYYTLAGFLMEAIIAYMYFDDPSTGIHHTKNVLRVPNASNVYGYLLCSGAILGAIAMICLANAIAFYNLKLIIVYLLFAVLQSAVGIFSTLFMLQNHLYESNLRVILMFCYYVFYLTVWLVVFEYYLTIHRKGATKSSSSFFRRPTPLTHDTLTETVYS